MLAACVMLTESISRHACSPGGIGLICLSQKDITACALNINMRLHFAFMRGLLAAGGDCCSWHNQVLLQVRAM